MNYLPPIIFSLIIVALCIFVLLNSYGIIKMPEVKTGTTSGLDKILEELSNLSAQELQELKFEVQQIFKNKNIILPTIP